MRRRINVWILGVLSLAFFTLSCESEYSKTVKSELAKGVRYDSLFHGISFGQEKKAFFELCFEKNREGLFDAGNRKNYVQTVLRDQARPEKSIDMFFYPDFDENENIIGMDMEYQYKGWSPWNDELYAVELLPQLKDTIKAWYGGNEFLEIPNEEDSLASVWVKVDGNRRIAMKVKDDQVVQVKFVDLTVEK